MRLDRRRTASCRDQTKDRHQTKSHWKTKKLRHLPNHRRSDQKTKIAQRGNGGDARPGPQDRIPPRRAKEDGHYGRKAQSDYHKARNGYKWLGIKSADTS